MDEHRRYSWTRPLETNTIVHRVGVGAEAVSKRLGPNRSALPNRRGWEWLDLYITDPKELSMSKMLKAATTITRPQQRLQFEAPNDPEG